MMGCFNRKVLLSLAAVAVGVLIFVPGQTTAIVRVIVRDDNIDEADELLVASFTNATNATIGGFFGLGLAVILARIHRFACALSCA